MIDPKNSITFKRRGYYRERYYVRLRVRRDRFISDPRGGWKFELRDPEKVARTITRWLARECERRGHISGKAEIAPVESTVYRERPSIIGTAHAFRSPDPEHIPFLRHVIDQPGKSYVEFLVYDDPEGGR